MADAVTTNVVHNGKDYYVVHFTNLSDTTGETTVTKVDKSTLTAGDGAAPASLDIQWIRWDVQGFAYVQLLWDHTTDDTAMLLTSSGYEDFRLMDDSIPEVSRSVGLADPRSTGGTGDILLTTGGGGAVTDTYDITICFRKNRD